MASGIRDKVAIIGMGCSRFGERWDCGPDDLMVDTDPGPTESGEIRPDGQLWISEANPGGNGLIEQVVEAAAKAAAAIVAEFYENGIWDQTKLGNDALRIKRDLTLSSLHESLNDLCVWSNPAGGLFVWVRMPEDVDRARLQALASERGVAYLPGSVFHHSARDVPYLRLAFGHLSASEITEGIPLLARCIREARTSNEARAFDTLFD